MVMSIEQKKQMDKITFVSTWFISSVLTLIFSVAFSFYLSTAKININLQGNNQNFKLYAALPQSEGYTTDNISFADARAKIIETLLKKHNSPLAEFSNIFVQVADKYQLDFRLLPAIAMQESLGGKRVIKNSFNPFGYGIYGDNVIKFASWEEAVEKVGNALRRDYLNKGLNTPDKIMAKYTPPSLANGGTWAKGVNSFMLELQ